ncbi:unnamed protein product [Symbiodinium sp. CCMP2592]|nr:unnamed protein product [Symbiodinium sp. CCMP2592]
MGCCRLRRRWSQSWRSKDSPSIASPTTPSSPSTAKPICPGELFRSSSLCGPTARYNAAIRSLSGDEANFPEAWETATKLFRQMTSDELQPDKGSFNALLSVYGNASRWTSVLQAVDAMCQVPWVSPDVITWSTAVDACGRSARWEAASYLMYSMRRLKLEANVVVWSALVKAYDRASHWDRAIATAVRMMHPGRQRRALPRPNAVALTSAASACAKGQAWQPALALLWTAQRWRLRPSLTAFNTALSACAASKQWRQALAGLGGLGPAADVVTRNVVLASLEFSRRWEHALALVESMVKEDFWPDIFSFNSLLSTFEKAAQWERAVTLLLRMLDFVVAPDDISCNVVVASCPFVEEEARWMLLVAPPQCLPQKMHFFDRWQRPPSWQQEPWPNDGRALRDPSRDTRIAEISGSLGPQMWAEECMCKGRHVQRLQRQMSDELLQRLRALPAVLPREASMPQLVGLDTSSVPLTNEPGAWGDNSHLRAFVECYSVMGFGFGELGSGMPMHRRVFELEVQAPVLAELHSGGQALSPLASIPDLQSLIVALHPIFHPGLRREACRAFCFRVLWKLRGALRPGTQAAMVRARRSGALAVALTVALCALAQGPEPAGCCSSPTRSDQGGMALKTLGFTESFNSEPSEEELPELKKAYRQAVRTSHPDAPGSAEKLLLVKEAYDFLLNAPTVTVWDEGVPVNERRGSTTYTSPGRKWPRYPQERPKAWKGPRRELIIGGVVLGTLVAIGIATQVVSTKPRDDYLASMGDMEEGVEGLGGSEKKLPPLVKSGSYKLGEVYRQFADESSRVKRPVLLMGELLAGRPGSGTVERATSLATLLWCPQLPKLSDLHMIAHTLARFESITAVVLQDDVQAELILVPAQKTYVDSSDLDPLAAKTLAENNSPGLFIFDITREQWAEQKAPAQSAFLALEEKSYWLCRGLNNYQSYFVGSL